MALDESPAARIHYRLIRRKNVEEKKMFGGLRFMLNGNMLMGVWNHEDDYIRHRVEVQLGDERLLKPLPHRDSSP